MMKFVTEEYLRDLYRKEPFATYKLELGQRLTPGGAQYLSDKRIKLDYNGASLKKEFLEKEVKEKSVKKENINCNLKKKLCCKLKSIEAICLLNSSEILKDDVLLSQNILSLGKKVSNVRKFVEGKESLVTIENKECTGINSLDFTNYLEDCFEITEFHIQLERSHAILKMHTIRCLLRELEFEVIECYEDDGQNKNDIIKNINSIINRLSQLICLAVGGKECQRKD